MAKQSFLFWDCFPFVSQVLENLQRSAVIQLLINSASLYWTFFTCQTLENRLATWKQCPCVRCHRPTRQCRGRGCACGTGRDSAQGSLGWSWLCRRRKFCRSPCQGLGWRWVCCLEGPSLAGELDVSDSVGPGLDVHRRSSAERGDVTCPDPYWVRWSRLEEGLSSWRLNDPSGSWADDLNHSVQVSSFVK